MMLQEHTFNYRDFFLYVEYELQNVLIHNYKKLAHAIDREFFQKQTLKISLKKKKKKKMKFLIFAH